MNKTLGIGGFFLREKDPVALADWQERNVCIATVPQNYRGKCWHHQPGETVFASCARDAISFG